MSRRMKNTSKYGLLLVAIGGWVCFAFYQFMYPYHLVYREQTSLFTYTSAQLIGYLDKPAVLSCLLGDFLLQFFHYDGGGAVIMTLLMLLLGRISYSIFRPWTKGWIALIVATIVPCWEVLRFCSLTYPLSSTLSLIGGLGLFLLFRLVKGKWTYMVSGLCGIALSYELFGYGMFAFLLCVLLSAVIRRRHYIGACLMLLEAFTLPFALSDNYLLTPAQAYQYPATGWWGTPNATYEHLLRLDIEGYSGNWQGVSQLAHPDMRTSMTSVLYNLANGMQAALPDRLMHYYQPAGLGLFVPVDESSTYFSTQIAGEIWFQLGDMTMAEHAAILSMIFSPQHKGARMIQRLAEINLINGDEEAAMKYLRLLSHTLAYKTWAKDRIPGKESEQVKQWLEQKRMLLPKNDTIRVSTTDVVKSLYLLLEANPRNQMACDYLLCFHLLMKDISSFSRDYQLFYHGKPNRLYAEALLIQLRKNHATGEEVKNTGMSPEVVKAFNDYSFSYNQYGGSPTGPMSRFEGTYWYYYHYAKF